MDRDCDQRLKSLTGGDFDRVFQAMAQGEVETRTFITYCTRFDDTVAEYPSWLRPESGVIKAV
jgi:hypothetical protein